MELSKEIYKELRFIGQPISKEEKKYHKKLCAEVAQLEALKVAAKAFVDQSEGVAWHGVSPQLGDGVGSLDLAYKNLKQALEAGGE